MKVGDGKEKHFLVEVKSDGAGEREEHHLPGHQDYVEEGKITQQRHSIDKKSKKTELGGKPTTPQLDSRPKKITAEPKPKPKDLKDYGSQLQVRRQMMQDKFELLSIGHL